MNRKVRAVKARVEGAAKGKRPLSELHRSLEKAIVDLNNLADSYENPDRARVLWGLATSLLAPFDLCEDRLAGGESLDDEDWEVIDDVVFHELEWEYE